jgi:hypothetical protein
MTGTKHGAPAGDYIVTITWPEEAPAKPKVMSTEQSPPDMPDRLNGRYSLPTRSTLQAVIKAGSNTIPAFDLQ